MYAAAQGKSTLGIPKSVGQDFVAAGPASPKLPARVTRKLHHQARRAAIKSGRSAPVTHAEFHSFGS